MATERLHIVPHDQGWAVKREGVSKPDSVYSTQKEAIDAGRDLARQDEVDLVVHRQDGTFRNVLTYTNDPMNGTNGKKVEAHDVLSVGSRVSWGAIVAGGSVALAINAALWLGGVALGITVSDKLGPRALTVAGAIWMTVSSLLSLFVGGFVVSRLTTGEEKQEAVLYGVIMWGFLFVCSLGLSGMGVAAGTQMASFRPASSGPLLNAEAYEGANLTQTQIDKLESKMQAAREEAGELSPQEAAWWAFTCLVVSMGAAIAGSWLGAGPTIFLFERRVQPKTQAVATA